ncbi:glycosyltransferase [Microbacterium enclense]|uniref:glycosyltransferase n=1 Tax=Microbacterium enclense TaxID=993073 RepID=UPI003F7FEAB9
MTDAPRVPSRTRPRPSAPGADDQPADELTAVLDDTRPHRSTIGCIVLASEHASSIAAAIAALLTQTRVPDVIHVVVANSSDATVEIASDLSGPHELHTELGSQLTEVFVHDIGADSGERAGALNYGYFLVEGYDYLLSVDGDAVAHPRAVERLEAEARSDSRIGGVSAIREIAAGPVDGPMARFLLAGQRAQGARSALQNLSRRNAAVLGGPLSIFSVAALRNVMVQTRRTTPWAQDADTEGLLLSLHLRNAGYLTSISPGARVAVPGMTTLPAYAAHEVRRIAGGIDLLSAGQRGDPNAQPLHSTLRVLWSENAGLLAGLFVRAAFLVLSAAALSTGAVMLSPWWLVPPVVTVLSNLRLALAMRRADHADVLFAALLIPAEAFRWVRIGCAARSWCRRLTQGAPYDRAARGTADGGLGRWALMTAVAAAVVALAAGWVQSAATVQTAVLSVGWSVVGVIAALQTLVMFSRLVRRTEDVPL